MVVNGELSCMVSGCAWAFSHVLLRSQESTVLWFCSLCNGTRAASSDNWVDSPLECLGLCTQTCVGQGASGECSGELVPYPCIRSGKGKGWYSIVRGPVVHVLLCRRGGWTCCQHRATHRATHRTLIGLYTTEI